MSSNSMGKRDQSQKEKYIHDAEGATTKQIFGARTAGSYAAFLLPHIQKGQRLLDIGCGQGTITIGLAEAIASGEVVGIDMEESLINAARDLAKEQGISNVRFEVGNTYELDFKNECFDVAYSNGVLEHLHQPVNALKEV
jgi:ubiquinone/menaquinone biosynthesis C-methylase UbiE